MCVELIKLVINGFRNSLKSISFKHLSYLYISIILFEFKYFNNEFLLFIQLHKALKFPISLILRFYSINKSEDLHTKLTHFRINIEFNMVFYYL